MYGGHIYAVSQGYWHSNVNRWSRGCLPYTSLANKEIVFPEVESYNIACTADDYEILSLFSGVPVYGTHAISHSWDASENATIIQFLLLSPNNDVDRSLSFPTSSLVVHDGPVAYHDLSTQSCLWVGSSGNYVLGLFGGDGYDHELCLIHYDRQINQSTIKVLTLPEFLSCQFADIYSIGLDDHLGKVFLIMDSGALCELSYV